MHWILQANLINPVDRARFERHFQNTGTPYSLAVLIPFLNELDNDVADPQGPVFVYGSTGLGDVAKKRGWTPGYFDENLDYELALRHYGERMLNAHAQCAPLGELTKHWDRFFIRPVLDTKSFAGTVMTWDELEAFRAGVASVADAPNVTLLPTDRVVMAPLVEVLAEFRLFVVDGQVVTGSRYKVGDQVRSSPTVPADVMQFARECLECWQPNKAFTLDIAMTPSGWRLIELNSANSAGVYACDVGKFIEAVNERLV